MTSRRSSAVGAVAAPGARGLRGRTVWLVLALLCVPVILLADAFDQGKDRYKAGDYAGAQALFQQHLGDNPDDANAWYNLGLADYKLKQYEEAVGAFRKAQQADPNIGFTSPEKFREKLAAAEEKAGTGSAAGSGGSPADYKDAKAQYDAGNYRDAAMGFQKYLQSHPDDAKAWYNLGLSLAKLKYYRDALAAYERAERADPSIGFTRKVKFEEKVAAARAQVGGSTGTGATSGGGGTSDRSVELAEVQVRALQQRNVLVDPGVSAKLSPADESALDSFAAQGTPRLKILVLAQEPPGGRAAYTLNLHRYLALGDTALIVVTPRGVSAHSDALSKSAMQRLTNDSARYFALSWREGIQHLGTAIRERVRAQAVAGRNTALVLAALVALLFWWGARRRRLELNRLLDQAKERMADLAVRLQDVEVDARLSKDQRAKDYYAQASQRFVEASALLEKVVTRADARRVLRLADESERLLGYSKNPDSAPREMPDPPAAGDDDDVAACFFCSRPSSEGVLRPASVTVEGETRRVLACRDCSQELKEGRMPRLRVVREGDEDVPWFRSSSYRPRRDWSRDDYDSRDLVVYHRVFHDYDYSRPSIIYVDDDRLVDRRMEAASAASLERHRAASSDFGSGSSREGAASTDFLSSDHS